VAPEVQTGMKKAHLTDLRQMSFYEEKRNYQAWVCADSFLQ
jgi:hypothetical protein